MGAAAELRKQIELALAGRIPAALSPRPLRSPQLVSCGVAEVDALLGGGLPLGTIVELTGNGSSGRTTLALSTLAGLTQQGQCCAYVDACDALDPLSAAALGVELRRLLWVRPPEAKMKSRKPGADSYQHLERALRATDLLLNAGGWGAVVLDLEELPTAQARRVPLATWYRFRLQAEKSRTLLLLLTPVGCANSGTPSEPSVGLPGLSCASVSLHIEETQARWRRAAESSPMLLAELHHRVSVSRGPQQAGCWIAGASSRSADAIFESATPKKPAASEQTWWSGTLSWPG